MTYDLNITFDDNLVTGNETIDTQHKELIDPDLWGGRHWEQPRHLGNRILHQAPVWD